MASSPTRRASCPSRWLNLVCKIPILLLGLSETNTIGYYLGVPSYRLQGYQAMLGVPVPDATQWDQIEVVGDCAYKVFAQMEHEAAQGELIFQDDTAVRILALLKENRRNLAMAQAQGMSIPQERTGMYTTALAVQVGEHTAILYDSSRRHAGENLQGLLEKREMVSTNRWPCRMRWRAMRWPMNRG